MTLTKPAVVGGSYGLPADSGEAGLVSRVTQTSEDAPALRRTAYLFALHLVRDPELARDLAQEAMLRLLQPRTRPARGRPVRPWLFAVVRNLAADGRRRRRIRRHEPLDEDLGRTLAHPAGGPEEAASRNELRREVWRAIGSLDALHREVLVLRDFHDLSYAEIAQVLGIPLGTVMSRLHAARRRLRERLESWRRRGEDPHVRRV